MTLHCGRCEVRPADRAGAHAGGGRQARVVHGGDGGRPPRQRHRRRRRGAPHGWAAARVIDIEGVSFISKYLV